MNINILRKAEEIPVGHHHNQVPYYCLMGLTRQRKCNSMFSIFRSCTILYHTIPLQNRLVRRNNKLARSLVLVPGLPLPTRRLLNHMRFCQNCVPMFPMLSVPLFSLLPLADSVSRLGLFWGCNLRIGCRNCRIVILKIYILNNYLTCEHFVGGK